MFTLLRLLPMTDHDRDAEVLALRHQLTVLRRQIDKPKLTWPDRALRAALLHRLLRTHLRRLHLIVSPDTVLRWLSRVKTPVRSVDLVRIPAGARLGEDDRSSCGGRGPIS